MTSFDSTFTNDNSNNNNSLRKKIVVGGALALLLGVATYSSRGGATKPRPGYFSLLRSNQGTVSEAEVLIGCALIKTTVEDAIGQLDEQLAELPDPLVLDKDYVWTKKNVPLNDNGGGKLGCRGDITITVASGASVSGLSQTNLEFNEESCRFRAFPRTTISGVWELSASSPSFELDAMVTAKATNCDINKGGSAVIKVEGPSSSATAGLSAGINLLTRAATITAVSVNDVEVEFGSAEIDLTPGGSHNYSPAEAAAITEMLNEEVLPAINEGLAKRMPISLSPDDFSTPEKARAFLEKQEIRHIM
eukprot:CAMPEP_0170763762 /NCGR_PEP_ID=MMETSP0733-20121128/3588_1 /TAXON_ID=186038 /ORGANISM="Fragilariopsis kerguelensis, Strain L26-C5" /LENGTH=305 /DNA_ID=CAMNT_0011104255 /DNA_START=84 /DNA_END=1001 /DNA_ORIENTATION=-